MLSGSKATTFQPAAHHRSSPQTSMTLNVLEYAFKSQPLTGDEVIIDAWCRTGKLAAELSQRLHGKGRVIGYDDAAEMIAFAKSKIKSAHKVTFLQRDFTSKATEFENEADILISAWHLPFIPEDKQQAYLQSLHNRVKPGGLFILTYPEAHPDLTKAIDSVVQSSAWNDIFEGKKIQSCVLTEARLHELLKQAEINIMETSVRSLRHQFSSKRELTDFIAGMLTNHLAYLTDETQHQAFIDDITSAYLQLISHTEKRIPYQVSVKTVTANQPRLENTNGFSPRSMQKYL